MRDFLLITHFLGLAMALGTSFTFVILKISVKSSSLAEQKQFLSRSFVISHIGALGLVLLIISGLMLLGSVWPIIKTNGLFHTKLTLVLFLTVLVGVSKALQKRAKNNFDSKAWVFLPKVGFGILITGLLTTVLAVKVFH